MNRKPVLFASALLLAVALSSCCKEGTNGEATLTVHLAHHGTPITSTTAYPDTIFIKFNADELPGTKPSDFDTYVVGTAGEDHVHVKNLKCGKYYLYGVGFDPAGPYRVTGGMGVKIKHGQRKDEQHIELAVTE